MGNQAPDNEFHDEGRRVCVARTVVVSSHAYRNAIVSILTALAALGMLAAALTLADVASTQVASRMAVDGNELQVGQSMVGTQIACIENCNELLDYAFIGTNTAPLSSPSQYRYAETQLFVQAESGVNTMAGTLVLTCTGPHCVTNVYTHTFTNNEGILWTVCRAPQKGVSINCSLSWAVSVSFKGANVSPLRSLLREQLCTTPGSGFGLGTTCIAGANPINNTLFTFYGGSFPQPEPPPPEPPHSEYCPDGYEVVSPTVTLAEGETWNASVETPWDRIAVRYTFRDVAGNLGERHYLQMTLNDTVITRDTYAPRTQQPDPNGGWLNDPFEFTVPNIDNPYLPDDYDPTAAETGPTANLAVFSGYKEIELVSACVIPQYERGYCPDGLEVLSEPVYLEPLGGEWETTVPASAITATHAVVRYTVGSPKIRGSLIDPDSALGKFMMQINYDWYYVQALMKPGTEITFTLPTTGVLRLFDGYDLFLRLVNRNIGVQLNSVCVVDGTEFYVNHLQESDCNLANPDFVTAPSSEDWETEGNVSWSNWQENGVVILDDGLVRQNARTGDAGVWTLEVRAKNGTLSFGTPRTALVDGGPQVVSQTLGNTYSLYGKDMYIKPGDWIFAQGSSTVDYVCLVRGDGTNPFREMECSFPVWDPSGSGDPLLIYLFKYIGDMIKWGVCELTRANSIVLYDIGRFLENIFLRIPALPDPGSGAISWLEFLGLLVDGLADLIGINLDELRTWFLQQLVNFTTWLYREVIMGFLWWLAEQLQMDPYDLLDILMAIWNEGRLFVQEMSIEMGIEMTNATMLLRDAANVLIVLANGVRNSVSGQSVAYIGKDFSGIGGFIWQGVSFINETVDLTPLSGLNILALGIITYGLTLWSGKKFVRILEKAGE